MKVYVLAHSWPYEGYDIPDAVFSTEQAARDRLEVVLKGCKRDRPDWEILEYELDDPKREPVLK